MNDVEKAEKQAAMTVKCAADNFYPGLHLLGMLSSCEVNAPRIAELAGPQAAIH